MTETVTAIAADELPDAAEPGAPLGWWRIMDTAVGVVPLPVMILGIALIGGYVWLGKVPADITTNIVILAVGGFLCAEFGKRIPGLRRIGAAAIFATFVPSFLVYVNVIPKTLKTSISDFTDQSNFLYLFITAIIVGSILGMERRMMISGFLKILVPILCGSVVAATVGVGIGSALGLGIKHTIFMIVVPVLGGGVGEGAIPLSVGYATISGGKDGELLAEILPAVMFGSLAAILLAGGLNLLGKRRPHLTGEGVLQKGEVDVPLERPEAPRFLPDLQSIGGALVLAVTLYLVGAFLQKLTNFPAPVTMLVLAVIFKLGRIVSPKLEQGAYRNYQFFAVVVTYPLLFAIGVSKTPWEKLMSAFNVPEVVTIVGTVASLVVTGFVVGGWMRLYPIEAAIITACRASQGGTGDVAILSASNRMVMMPFAQVATRLGGAITVTLALAMAAHYGL